MLNNNEKLLNVRPIIIICANLILGILCAVTLCYSVNLYIFLGCVFLLFNFSLIVYFIAVKNKRAYVTVIIALVLSLIVLLTLSNKIFINLNTINVGNVTLVGEIVSINKVNVTDYGYSISAYVKITQGELNDATIFTYFNSDNLLFEGYKINFNADVNACKIYSKNYFNTNVLRFSANYVASNVKILSVNTQIENPFYYVKRLLYYRLQLSNAKYVDIIYALITGDTNFISSVTLSKFRDVGVAHIFAVSGLHVGFLYALVSLILKPIKINKIIKYLATLILLYLYVTFCGATASCLRAFIIIAVSNFAKTFGLKNDRLSSVFFSMILVLIINPADLFNVGFYLSYFACLSLIFLTPKLEKVLNRIFPQKVSKFIAPFISAYLGTLPLITDFFSNSTALSMLFNAFIVPFMSFIFTLSFITCVIVLIFSKLVFIINVCSFFVSLIVWFVNTFSFIVISVSLKFSISMIFYYFGLTIYCGLINVNKKYVKIIYVLNFAIFLLVFLLINISILP